MRVSYSERIKFLLTKNVRGNTRKKLKQYAKSKKLSASSRKRINSLYQYHKDEEEEQGIGISGLTKYLLVISYTGSNKKSEIDFDGFVIAESGRLKDFEKAVRDFVEDRHLDALDEHWDEFRIGEAEAGDLKKGYIETGGNKRFEQAFKLIIGRAME